jgi:hypothetical protein
LDLINIKRGRASPRFFAWIFLIFKHQSKRTIYSLAKY